MNSVFFSVSDLRGVPREGGKGTSRPLTSIKYECNTFHRPYKKATNRGFMCVTIITVFGDEGFYLGNKRRNISSLSSLRSEKKIDGIIVLNNLLKEPISDFSNFF